MNKKVRLKVQETKCNYYNVGDEIVFDGPLLSKENQVSICMTAMQALYPYVFAARLGNVWESTIQCPDCTDCVKFKVEIAESE